MPLLTGDATNAAAVEILNNEFQKERVKFESQINELRREEFSESCKVKIGIDHDS